MKSYLQQLPAKRPVGLAEIVVVFVAIILLLPDKSHGDAGIWAAWSAFFKTHDFTSAYDVAFIDYPPLFVYVLKFFSIPFANQEEIAANISWLKIFPLIFDLLPLVVLLVFYKNLEHLKWAKYLLLLNIAYFYNSVLWGQVDSVHNGFIAIAGLLLFSRPLLSVFLIVLAFNTKIQTLSAIPVIAVALIPYIRANKTNILRIIVVAVATQLLILAPFILAGNIKPFLKVTLDSVGHFPVVSMNAPNVWRLLLSGDLYSISSNAKFAGVTYRTWGLLMFFASSGLAMLPIFLLSIKRTAEQFRSYNITALLALTMGITNLLFFYFNTEMHERYGHGCMILFFVYGAFTRRMDLFIVNCIFYFLTVDSVLNFFKLDQPHFYYNATFISLGYLFNILLAFYHLYKISAESNVEEVAVESELSPQIG